MAGLIVALLLSACASRVRLSRVHCTEPDAQLAEIWQSLEAERAKGCTEKCERLRRDLERLSIVCPTHAPTLTANAVLAYDEGQSLVAQQLLDLVLGQPGPHADAAVLRARIAMEEGNLPYAVRLLEQQIALSPDHATLHETLGATLYLAKRFADAERELGVAERLGAPVWRTAYHLGLIREAEGRNDDAMRLYSEALAANPGYAAAESRLKALRARPRTSVDLAVW